VLADMEMWGVGIDMDACLNARHILIKKLKQLEKEAYELAGMPFSLHAAADIANVLYRHLKLPAPKGCDKGKLHPSTNKQSLDILRYGILIGKALMPLLTYFVWRSLKDFMMRIG
jgi:DNA polymerase theta